MGLQDTIRTLEVRREAGQNVVQELATSYARIAARKASQRLFWAWFDELEKLMRDEGRYGELIEAAGGVDPARIGWRDAQEAIDKWRQEQA